MGVGKTSVGRILARRLRFRLVDTDQWIEAEAGKSIARIFAEDGEPAFRERERQLVATLAELQRTVIATGGGLAANVQNLAALKTHALVVYLWASPEKLGERARHLRGRPLLKAPDLPARIRELMAQRDPVYRQADVLINTERRALPEIAEHVAHQFRLAQRSTE